MNINELISTAFKARENAYTPYSNFKVGVALLTKSGEVYTGCNIENSSYSVTVCAERVALFKAVSESNLDFTAIAVVGGKDGEIEIISPCGTCRQALIEFCSDDLKVIMAKSETEYKIMTLAELMPLSFNKNNLYQKS